MSRRVCAQCGMVWRDGRTTCYNCGFAQAVVRPDPFSRSSVGATLSPGSTPVGTATIDRTDEHLLHRPASWPQDARPQRVTVTDVQLSWGSAVSIAIKFAVIFTAMQIIAGVILYLVLR